MAHSSDFHPFLSDFSADSEEATRPEADCGLCHS